MCYVNGGSDTQATYPVRIPYESNLIEWVAQLTYSWEGSTSVERGNFNVPVKYWELYFELRQGREQ